MNSYQKFDILNYKVSNLYMYDILETMISKQKDSLKQIFGLQQISKSRRKKTRFKMNATNLVS